MEYIEDQPFEKRGYKRITLETQVVIKPIDEDPVILGWIQDISHGGFKVRIDISLNFRHVFHNGDMVIFKTDEDFLNLKGRGEIRWTSTEGAEAGNEFDELHNNGRKFFEEFLRICS